jgi:hypothetical protein
MLGLLNISEALSTKVVFILEDGVRRREEMRHIGHNHYQTTGGGCVRQKDFDLPSQPRVQHRKAQKVEVVFS